MQRLSVIEIWQFWSARCRCIAIWQLTSSVPFRRVANLTPPTGWRGCVPSNEFVKKSTMSKTTKKNLEQKRLSTTLHRLFCENEMQKIFSTPFCFDMISIHTYGKIIYYFPVKKEKNTERMKFSKCLID